MSRKKILIVEDEAIVAESIAETLAKYRYDVVGIAFSGEEAVSMARKFSPDLILMDIILAGEIDGVEASEIIKKSLSVPIIFLTANSDETTLQRAKITEPFGYITKPYREKELHSAVSVAIYKHEVEVKLKKNEKWLSTILSNICDAVISVDPEGNVNYLSPVAEKLTGWELKELSGEEFLPAFFSSLGYEESLIKDLLKKTALGETINCVVDQTPNIKTRSGNLIPVDIGASPLFDENSDFVGTVFVIRDVSRRVKEEETLADAQSILAKLLTPREKEVLKLMVGGLTTKKIATELDISPRTVEAHRHNMMQKLNIHEMTMLIRSAITHRLVPLV